MIYLELLWVFIEVGALSIGGGYASIPILQSQVVEARGWMTLSEFTDLVTIAEMTPGPIAVNAATFVGNRMAGVLGGIVATLGCILPALLLVSLLAFAYYRWRNLKVMQETLAVLRPAVVALIAGAGLSILVLSFWGESGFSADIADLRLVPVLIFGFALFVLRKFRPNPVFVLLGSGLLGAILLC